MAFPHVPALPAHAHDSDPLACGARPDPPFSPSDYVLGGWGGGSGVEGMQGMQRREMGEKKEKEAVFIIHHWCNTYWYVLWANPRGKRSRVLCRCVCVIMETNHPGTGL